MQKEKIDVGAIALREAISSLERTLQTSWNEVPEYQLEVLKRQLDLLRRTAERDVKMAEKVAEDFGLLATTEVLEHQ